MSRLSESSIERKLVDGVKKLGGMCIKFTSPGTPGVPDRIIITADSRIIFAELKADRGRLSKLQAYTIEEMRKRGADVRIVKGVNAVNELLEEIKGDDVL